MASLRVLLAALVLVVASAVRAASAAPVGLFLAGGDRDGAEAGEIRRGAELAAEECGGACPLMVATNAGQWTAGASELVRFVYSEGITAVLGPVDSRSAHLAEQVVTRAKGRFLLLTPWASDPTLTQIKVPWFFRLVPDDARQAAALLEEIHAARGVRRLATVIAEFHHDSRIAADAFAPVARARGLEPHEIPVREDPTSLDGVVADVRNTHPEAVMLFAPPDVAARVARRLREAGITAPFFGPLRLAAPTFLDAAAEAAEGMVLAAPAESLGPAAQRFRARHGKVPSAPAAYGYDGAAVLIDALRTGDSGDIESVRAALAATRRDGMTGRIEFDPSGNRAGPAALSQVEHGHLRPLRRDPSSLSGLESAQRPNGERAIEMTPAAGPSTSTTEHVSLR